MNLYVIKHNGKTYIGRNLITLKFLPNILQGKKSTEYIAFGKGRGTPAINRYSLFMPLGTKRAETTAINADCSKGGYYIVRKITLGADEFVGETITELGFCAVDGELVTHCVLAEGVLKENEPMDIYAILRLPKADGLFPGDNPLVRILLGVEEFSASKLSYGYCNFRDIQDAYAIKDRYLCAMPNPSLFRMDCPLVKTDKTDIIIFYDDVPVLRADARCQISRSQLQSFTVGQNGVIPLEEIKNIKIASITKNSVSIFGGIQLTPDQVSSEFFRLNLASSDQKIFVSKDRGFLLAVSGNIITVYQDVLGSLQYLGDIVLEGRVSCLDVCMSRLAVVCNHADTPLGNAGRRLRFFQFANGKIIEKEVTGDLDSDAQAISLEYAGGNNMVLYYLSGGVLTGLVFSYDNPVLTYNCSFAVNKACFVKTSYRRNAVLVTDFEHNLDSSYYKTLLGGGYNPFSGPSLLSLKSILPDQMHFSGEIIAALNSETKTASAYSFLSGNVRIARLNNYMQDIKYTFLDGQYIFITNGSIYKILKIDSQDAEARELTSGQVPCGDIDQVFIMLDLLVIKSKDNLYLARVLSEKGFIYSDQFAYGEQVMVRLADVLTPAQSSYNACAVVLNIVVA
ncbi:MAG TPA: hypothetical protein VIL23_01735 [Clostridia bacterium]